MNTKRLKRNRASTPGHEMSTYGEMPRPGEPDELPPYSGDSIATDLKETARTAGRAVGEQAKSFAADVGHEISKRAEDQKARGIDAMRGFAEAVNTAAQQLEQQSPQVARHVRQAADSLRTLSGNIEGRNINELMGSATDLARSNPALFFAGAVAAGFALSRFLKSSAQHHAETTTENQLSEDWDVESAETGVDHGHS